jgi:hypothetical protein
MSAVQASAPQRLPSSIQLQAYAPVHREGVMRLSGQVFGPGSEVGLGQRLAWIDRAAEDDLRPMRWVLVAGDAVVGFLGAVPLRYRLGDRVQVAYTPSEYMVHPRHRFHGIRLMRAFFDDCADCVTCDDVEATVKVTEWLGARPVGRMVRHTKVLDARVLKQRAEWAHAALPGLGVATWGLAAADRIRARRHRRTEVVPVETFDARFDAFFAATGDGRTASVVRDARFLNWRYGPASPHPDREIRVVTDGADLAGYVVFHRSTREGRVGRILDLQVRDPADQSTFDALLVHAVAGLRALGAWSARFHHLESAAGHVPAILREQGFGAREHHVLLVRFRDPGCAALAGAAERWRLSFGDTEASFAAR